MKMDISINVFKLIYLSLVFSCLACEKTAPILPSDQTISFRDGIEIINTPNTYTRSGNVVIIDQSRGF